MKRNYIKRITSLILALFVILSGTRLVHASGEEVYFGSESYEWELGETSTIGSYAEADESLETVYYVLTYDPEMLEFESGGELIEDGQIRISETDIGSYRYRTMTNFVPQMAGQTEISITKAEVTEEGGETVVLETVTAPVDIPIPSGCYLETITVNGDEIEGFDPDITEYEIELFEYAESVEVDAIAAEVVSVSTATNATENSSVEISGTGLMEGVNDISIVVTNEDGEKARYLLHVTCPLKEEAVSTEVTEITTEEPETTEEVTEAVIIPTENNDTGLVSWVKNHPLLTILIAILVIGIILLIIYLLRIRKERSRTRRERELQKYRESLRQQDEDELEDGTEEVTEDNTDKEDTKNAENEEDEDYELERALRIASEIESREAGENKESESETAVTETSEDLEEDEDDTPTEIIVDHVTMDFKVEKDEATSIKEAIIKIIKRQHHVTKFRALSDISFTVKKGDVVGIIGTNGSGKSTILKIISGALTPTAGKVVVDRDKIQLLTLGTGFDSELTGKENVYLNGSIIGYTKEFIDEKYDDIVEFAELEGFMDEKVRNYSSGMISRLGFAIATARETPEILILDEVLSVGDMFFRKKSIARIKEMIHGGSTVLIVSHSPAVIRSNCNKVVWIEKGNLRAVGDPATVCKAYENMNKDK